MDNEFNIIKILKNNLYKNVVPYIAKKLISKIMSHTFKALKLNSKDKTAE